MPPLNLQQENWNISVKTPTEIRPKLAKTTSRVTKPNQQAHMQTKLKPTAGKSAYPGPQGRRRRRNREQMWFDFGTGRKGKGLGREKDGTLISPRIPHQNIDGNARAAGAVAIRESHASLPSQSSQTNIIRNLEKKKSTVTQLLEQTPPTLAD